MLLDVDSVRVVVDVVAEKNDWYNERDCRIPTKATTSVVRGLCSFELTTDDITFRCTSCDRILHLGCEVLCEPQNIPSSSDSQSLD